MSVADKLFIEDLDVSGRKVIVRVDFNVPINGGKVDNDKRIRAALPTINYLTEKGARVILMSHLGRPKGQVVDSMRMKPVAEVLGKLTGKTVCYTPECIGPEVKNEVSKLENGEILLLENLRFHPEEEKNEEGFAKELSSLAEIYVNDAFGTAHRAHASTEGITKFISICASGYLMKKELDYLGGVLKNPQSPFIAILGGAKVSDKIMVIEHLLPLVDKIIIGGGMTFTFLKAKGLEIGNSLLEVDRLETAKNLLERAGDKIVLPTDFLVSDTFDFAARKVGDLTVASAENLPANKIGLDIGPDSIESLSKIVKNAKTVIWNGPMGVFEIEETAKGTFAIAHALAEATTNGATTVIGGGDSASAIKKSGLSDKVSHVSTGGGASLEFLEGKELPGVTALSNK